MGGFRRLEVAQRAAAISGDVRSGIADRNAEQVGSLIHAYRRNGYGWRKSAMLLNLGGYTATWGGQWKPEQVRRAYMRWLSNGGDKKAF